MNWRNTAQHLLGLTGIGMILFPAITLLQLLEIMPILNEITVKLTIGSQEPITISGGYFLIALLFYMPIKHWIIVEGWRLWSKEGVQYAKKSGKGLKQKIRQNREQIQA